MPQRRPSEWCIRFELLPFRLRNPNMNISGHTVPIDIAIVTHSRDEQLLRCISHILGNSRLPRQIIIIHSQPARYCTTKPQIMRLCRQVGVQIRYIHASHRGISYSRNIAVRHVTSPLFGFIDDDEYPPADWLERVHGIFTAAPSVQVVSGPKIPSDLSNYWNRIWYELYRRSLGDVAETDFVTSSNSFFRTGFIRKYGIGFDEEFRTSSEDLVFSHRLINHGATMMYYGTVVDYHDFRTTLSGFVRQWYGYGRTMALFEKKYMGLSGSASWHRVRHISRGCRLLRESGFSIWPGLILLDLSLWAGYLSFSLQLGNRKYT